MCTSNRVAFHSERDGLCPVGRLVRVSCYRQPRSIVTCSALPGHSTNGNSPAVLTRDLPLQETVDTLNQINPDLAHHYAVNHVEIRKKLNEAMRQNIDLTRNIAARASITEDPAKATESWNTGTGFLRSLGMGDLVDRLSEEFGGQEPSQEYFEGILGTLQACRTLKERGKTTWSRALSLGRF